MNNQQIIPNAPAILTTTVGSYPVPDWLSALPSEQAVIDAPRVIFDTQRQAGIDLPTDGELYRFDVNHPDTNGMIEYFTGSMGGCDSGIGRADSERFRTKHEMGFRAKPAAVVREALHSGKLNLIEDCIRAEAVAGGPFKFTVTSPYMLARTLLDTHYHNFDEVTLAIADVLAEQVKGLPCACLQVDEANIPGNPDHAPLAAEAEAGARQLELVERVQVRTWCVVHNQQATRKRLFTPRCKRLTCKSTATAPYGPHRRPTTLRV